MPPGRLAFGPPWKTDGGLGLEASWIVTEPDGGVIHPDTLLSRCKRLVKTAGVMPIGLQGARHSYAELALSARRQARRGEPATRPRQHRHDGKRLRARLGPGRRGGGRARGTDDRGEVKQISVNIDGIRVDLLDDPTKIDADGMEVKRIRIELELKDAAQMLRDYDRGNGSALAAVMGGVTAALEITLASSE